MDGRMDGYVDAEKHGKTSRTRETEERGKERIVSEQKGQITQGTFQDAFPVSFWHFLFQRGHWEVTRGEGPAGWGPQV